MEKLEDKMRLMNSSYVRSNSLNRGNAGNTVSNGNYDSQRTQQPDQCTYNTKKMSEYFDQADSSTDEDTCGPFEMLAENMKNITKDGGIKKRILYEGDGGVLSKNTLATIYYNAYAEYLDQPFDSTYIQKRPYIFHLNEEAANSTLRIAVQTMKVNEESQFLIESKYTCGALGCLEQVPLDSTILLEITVQSAAELDSIMSFSNSTKEEIKEFSDIYKYAHALSSKAKDLCDKQLYKQALKEYSTAVDTLEGCDIKEHSDQEKQQQLLLRLLTNVVTLCTKLEEPRRACANCRKIYNMCKGTSLKIPVKVHFNHARSLMLLSDFKSAERKLRDAQRLEPHNEAITKELAKLDAKRKEKRNREMALKKTLYRNTEVNKSNQVEVTKEFCESITQYCKDLRDDYENAQYSLPDKLTKKELAFTEKEVHKYGFTFKHRKLNGVDKYFIVKPRY